MRINNEDILEIDGVRATVSLGANATLKPVWLGHVASFAIQLVFTGTPNGTFKLQASCDPGSPNSASEAQQYASVTNWTDVSGSDQAITAAGNHMWTTANPGYQWVRVVWTQSSSTGTITTARATVKGI